MLHPLICVYNLSFPASQVEHVFLKCVTLYLKAGATFSNQRLIKLYLLELSTHIISGNVLTKTPSERHVIIILKMKKEKLREVVFLRLKPGFFLA